MSEPEPQVFIYKLDETARMLMTNKVHVYLESCMEDQERAKVDGKPLPGILFTKYMTELYPDQNMTDQGFILKGVHIINSRLDKEGSHLQVRLDKFRNIGSDTFTLDMVVTVVMGDYIDSADALSL